MFTLNPHSGLPLYRQLMEQLRRMIASAQLQPGDLLPSVRELALLHAVNPMTISKAYSLLEAEGLLERQRGRGMVVAEQPGLQENKRERLERLRPVLDQVAMAAEQLRLDAEDVITALRERLEKNDE